MPLLKTARGTTSVRGYSIGSREAREAIVRLLDERDRRANLSDFEVWTVRMLAHLAGELFYRARWKDEHDWFESPQVGDLVVEVSMQYWPNGSGLDHFTRIGRLLGEDTIVEGEGDDAVVVDRRVIALADGRVFGWSNERLVRVPEEAISFYVGSGCGTFTRIPLRLGGFLTPPEWAERTGHVVELMDDRGGYKIR